MGKEDIEMKLSRQGVFHDCWLVYFGNRLQALKQWRKRMLMQSFIIRISFSHKYWCQVQLNCLTTHMFKFGQILTLGMFSTPTCCFIHISLYWCSPNPRKERNTKLDLGVFDALLQLPPSCFSILISQTKPPQIGLIEITCFLVWEKALGRTMVKEKQK